MPVSALRSSAGKGFLNGCPRMSPLIFIFIQIGLAQSGDEDLTDLQMPTRIAALPMPFPLLSPHNLLYFVPLAIFLLIHTKTIPEIQPRIR
ncbi:unnamed protein product, partial [Mesorhabditis spiculigera]